MRRYLMVLLLVQNSLCMTLVDELKQVHRNGSKSRPSTDGSTTVRCETYYHSEFTTFDNFEYDFADPGPYRFMENEYDNVFVQVLNFGSNTDSPHCAVAVRSLASRPGETQVLDYCNQDHITAWKCQEEESFPVTRSDDGIMFYLRAHNGMKLTATENNHCIIIDIDNPVVPGVTTWGLCGNSDGNPGNEWEILPGDGNTDLNAFLNAAKVGPDYPNFFLECNHMATNVTLESEYCLEHGC